MSALRPNIRTRRFAGGGNADIPTFDPSKPFEDVSNQSLPDAPWKDLPDAPWVKSKAAPRFVPVDHDPFAKSGPKLVPVDHDPWAGSNSDPRSWGAQPIDGGDHPLSWGARPINQQQSDPDDWVKPGETERGPWDEYQPREERGPWDDWVPAGPPGQAQFKGVGRALVEGAQAAPGVALENAKQKLLAAWNEYQQIGQHPDLPTDSILGAAGQGIVNRISDLTHAGKAMVNYASIASAPGDLLRETFGPAYGEALHAVGSVIAPRTAAKDRPEDLYNMGRNAIDTASLAAAPRGVSPIGIRAGAQVAVPPRPQPTGPLDVNLSAGQRTGDLDAIRREQAALSGQLGTPAERVARTFADVQAQELAAAKDKVARGLDPYGQRVAEGPQEAADLVQRALQTEAANRKAGVRQAYETAQALPGEVHADVFRGIGDSIKTDLSARPEPVIIDDKLTPYASKAVDDIEQNISRLKIQNRADPNAAPDQESIAGVTLKGVDQARRRLAAFSKSAYESGNRADGRAARAVLDSFDDHIDAAVNNGSFRGDPRAVQAWNDARAANADYRGTFTAKKGDPVGRVVEKIIGKSSDNAAIPNDVADFIYGGTGVNPSSLNVGVAKRVRNILGDQSPEWSGVKQGLFSRLVEPPPGVNDWNPGKVSQRLNRFLNGDGKEMAETIFTLPERDLLKQYADLQKALEIPATGVNRSETSTFVAPMLKRIGNGIASLVGAAIGHTIAPGAFGAAEVIGAGIVGKGSQVIREAAQARKIAQQMPLMSDAVRRWQKAVAAANRKNTPLTSQAAALATGNLVRVLRRSGIDTTGLPALQAGSSDERDFSQSDSNPIRWGAVPLTGAMAGR